MSESAKKFKGGRPPKITAAVVEEVCEHMALGVPEEYACALVGVNPETFGPAVCRSAEFKAIKRRHDARFMADSLKKIRDGGEWVQVKGPDGTPVRDEAGLPVLKHIPWQGRAWIMERRYKPHFTKTDIVKDKEGAGEQGGLMPAATMAELERMTKEMVREMEQPVVKIQKPRSKNQATKGTTNGHE